MALQVAQQDFLTNGVGASAPSANTIRLYGDQVAGGLSKPYSRSIAGRVHSFQSHLAKSRVAMATANGDTTILSQHGIAISTTGTPTIAAVSSASFYQSQRRLDILVTAASTSAVAGFYSAVNQFYRGNSAGRGGFHFTCRWMPTTGQAATTRGFCGLSSIVAAPTDADPSTALTDALGMGWDTADSSIQIMHRTGSGTTAKESLLGIQWPIPSANTTVFEFEMYCPPNGSTVYWRLTNLTTGATPASGSLTTDLPANTTMLSPRCYMSVAGVSSVIGVSFLNMYIETDN